MDFSLSFLDSYVSAAIEAGAQPYRTASLRQMPAMKSRNDVNGNLFIYYLIRPNMYSNV